jgi:hypothetical protein
LNYRKLSDKKSYKNIMPTRKKRMHKYIELGRFKTQKNFPAQDLQNNIVHSTDGGIVRTSIYYEYIKCLLTYRKTVEKLNGEMIYNMLCDTYTQVYNMIQSKHLVPGNNR